jgi:four helix bundle protein
MSDSPIVFPHHKLDVYNVAVEFAVAVRALIAHMPRGNAALADQLSRSSISTVTNTAEGANRIGTGEKRQKYSIARGEVGEAAACIELAAALGLVPQPKAQAALRLAGRIAAMLTQLIRRLGA